jgi:hypothetical protein
MPVRRSRLVESGGYRLDLSIRYHFLLVTSLEVVPSAVNAAGTPPAWPWMANRV